MTRRAEGQRNATYAFQHTLIAGGLASARGCGAPAVLPGGQVDFRQPFFYINKEVDHRPVKALRKETLPQRRQVPVSAEQQLARSIRRSAARANS